MFPTTDASNRGIGAILSQMQEGKEKIIAFASRTLKDAEINYSTIEKEALSCFWATNHFTFFLWGIPFVLRTDHKPLLSLFSSKNIEKTTPRIGKWLVYLQNLNFKIEYVPGNKNELPTAFLAYPSISIWRKI